MNIYRSGVPLTHGVCGVHGADERTLLPVDELVGATTGSADVDQVGGRLGVRPVPAVGAAAQVPLLHQAIQQSGGMRSEEA